MLYSISPLKPIREIPHRDFYDKCCARLSSAELDAIRDKLNSMIDSDEVHTSSWMPGHDWTGTVFQPIYEKACRHDLDASAQFFGLLVWVVFHDRPDAWAFGRYEKDNVPIRGLTYFRIQIP